MNLLSLYQSKKVIYFNFLMALLPASFIAGNMIININVILIILSTIFIFKNDFFKIKYYSIDVLIFAYFFLIIITGIINDYNLSEVPWRANFATTIKSLLFLKYLLLYISLRLLIENRILNFRSFFISCLLTSIFVCFDIFYQLFNGKDIFGYEPVGAGRKLSGPFKDELIAGGFIQRFSIFSFFLLPIFYYDKSQKFSKYLIPILFFIFFLGLILSGNRMPLILFIFTIFLIFLFNRKIRKYLFFFIVIFSLIFYLVFNFNSRVKDNFLNFHMQLTKMIIILIDSDFKKANSPNYLKEFSTFYDTFQLNKYLGGGIKNFRYYCHHRPNIDTNSEFICNMHPHNYYLEILTETGIVGFILISIIFISILYSSFFKRYFLNKSKVKDNVITPFIFLFIAEIFPIKSTGSFFTTGNTTYLIILMAIIIGYSKIDKLIEK